LSEGGHRDADLLMLGRAVRGARRQRGLSVEQLAGAAGLSRQGIAALEAGLLDPTYEVLLAVAGGLELELSALVALVEPPVQ
jgi:transcriptional regulator with XRE-family HTH domain